jgi:hypothetical protein
MLSPADSETISRVVGDFADAYRIASNKGTRSSTDVQTKDQLRRVAEKLCQGYANRISANVGVSDQAKRAISVNPRNFSRTKIFVQQSQPVLAVQGATVGEHHLRCHDSLTPTRASKPFGAICLELYCATGEAPASNREEAKSIGIFSRNLSTVRFEHAYNKKVATYWARWCGKHALDFGPWSLPVSMTIAA